MVKSWTLINIERLYLCGDETSLPYFQANPADCLHWAIHIVLIQDHGYLTLCTAWWVPLPPRFPQGVTQYNPGITIACFSKPSLRHSWVGQNLLCDYSGEPDWQCGNSGCAQPTQFVFHDVGRKSGLLIFFSFWFIKMQNSKSNKLGFICSLAMKQTFLKYLMESDITLITILF